MSKLWRINVGCGQSPTEGWLNMDNSMSIRLARLPWLTWLPERLGLIDHLQADNLAFNRKHSLVYCDARKRIPVADGSTEVIYSSHMLEHLDRSEARQFLLETRRVLCSGGILRIAVPNLRFHVNNYLGSGDADEFMREANLERHRPKTLLGRVRIFLIGDREGHCVMYDPASLVRLLVAQGFVSVVDLQPNQTLIPSPEPLNLSERSSESLYVEGVNP